MLFWAITLVLTLAVAGLIGRALMSSGDTRGAAESDMAVYKDQLAEVDRDLARGVLTEVEAEAVRTEVARRLLEADRRAEAEETVSRSGAKSAGLAVILVALLAGGLGVYAWIGAPGYGDLPLERRFELADEARRTRPSQKVAEMERGQPPEGAGEVRIEELMERLRGVVAERPDDLQGATLLAQNEARLGRFIAAREAQENVIRIKGEDTTVEDWLLHVDFLVLAAGGYVSPEAEAALGEVLERAPDNSIARYYSGLLFAQNGRPDRAFALWRQLLEAGPETAPYMPPIRAEIMDLAEAAGVRYTPPALRGPTAADMAAASDMSTEDREAMIRNMVDGLAERLATDGGTAQDWARLITALGVLGEDARAEAILAEARMVFAGDDASRQAIEDAARQAGYE